MTDIEAPPQLDPDSLRVTARPVAFAPALAAHRQSQAFVETKPDGTRVLIGAYYFRDVQLNPTIPPDTFTAAGLKK